jgi:acetyltransferase-like isoleucine patch superfamily enzyme
VNKIITRVKENAKLKRLLLYLMIPAHQARPRTWISFFVNPWIHKKGKGAIVRRRTRLDVFPFNEFILGNHSIIEDFSTINNGLGHVKIGKHVTIGLSSVIIGPVAIGDHVILAQNIVVSGLNHSYQDIEIPIHMQKCTTSEIIIEDECWIGANAVITAGVRIGKHAVVAAGSIVTKDVPAYSVYAGNPAKMIKKYNPVSKIWEKVL